jgi:hypothetical protein
MLASLAFWLLAIAYRDTVSVQTLWPKVEAHIDNDANGNGC